MKILWILFQATSGKDVLAKAVSALNRLDDQNDTKELFKFLADEDEKKREQELKLFEMQCKTMLNMIRMTRSSYNGHPNETSSPPIFLLPENHTSVKHFQYLSTGGTSTIPSSPILSVTTPSIFSRTTTSSCGISFFTSCCYTVPGTPSATATWSYSSGTKWWRTE